VQELIKVQQTADYISTGGKRKSKSSYAVTGRPRIVFFIHKDDAKARKFVPGCSRGLKKYPRDHKLSAGGGSKCCMNPIKILIAGLPCGWNKSVIRNGEKGILRIVRSYVRITRI
jgi:hypothetical protein